MIHGFDVFRMYLAMKLHFTKENYDYFESNGKARANEENYQQRNDFYFFETLARKYTKEEIQELLFASFFVSEEPSKVWIGSIKKSGKDCWLAWKKAQQSLTYTFEQDTKSMVGVMATEGYTFNTFLSSVEQTHPPLLKLLIKRRVNLETFIVMDIVLGFTKQWDKNLHDPLWENISLKVKKIKPFLSIDSNKYRHILKEKFCD